MNQSVYLSIENSCFGLYGKFCALRDTQLAWYTNEALKHFGLKRLPDNHQNQLIRQILGKSPTDNKNKQNEKTYYVANVVAYLSVVRNLLTDDFVKRFSDSNSCSELVIYNYHRVFRNLLFDSLLLLNNYSVNIEKKGESYQLGKNPWQHTLTIYQSLRQSIFGQESFHSFREVEPDLSISLIRQLVELRVRRSFGILGWYDSEKDSFEPLFMSRLFEVLAEYRSDIDFSIPFDCLVRIYGWSNIFLHTGIKDYSWKHIFVKDYLKEFSLGKEGKSNVNNGIAIPGCVLKAIVLKLESEHPSGAQLVKVEPEANILQEKSVSA